MVIVKNLQRKIKLDSAKLEHQARFFLELVKYAHFDLSIVLVNNSTMQSYNRLYRNKNTPTDILSFPMHPNAQPTKRIKATDQAEKNLGDIIMSPEYILADIGLWNQPLEERIIRLLVHGICHLLGYDHETNDEHKKMHRKEQWMFKRSLQKGFRT